MSDPELRILDTGVMEGRVNIALGQAIVEAHQAGGAPDTLRFLRFPPTALVGRHQALGQEIDVDYCRENGVGLARRITGGGAIFLDPGQLGWELAINRKTLGSLSLPDVTRAICEAMAEGLQALGVDARYRPRNDIEVDGRKISGTGGFFDGDTLFFQGTVLVDMNPEHMVRALKVPQAKLAKRELDSAAQRVVTLKQLLGESTPSLEQIQSALTEAFCKRFQLVARPSELGEAEKVAAAVAFEDEIGTEEFLREIDEPSSLAGTLQGSHSGPGGTVTAYVRLEGPGRDMIRNVLLTGDFFITPPRVIFDLEARLRGRSCKDIEPLTLELFQESRVEALSVQPQDFVAAIEAALHS